MLRKIVVLALTIVVLLLTGVSGAAQAAPATANPIRRCGQLRNAWGPWRWTEGVRTPRTVYFNPERTGRHKIQFYQDLCSTEDGCANDTFWVTPYWSNDNGQNWHSWNSVDFGDGRTHTMTLRTDHNYTRYKFVFAGVYPVGAAYRFFCAGNP